MTLAELSRGHKFKIKDIPDELARICSRCGYPVKDETLIRCPRCHLILLKKCSECNKCDL